MHESIDEVGTTLSDEELSQAQGGGGFWEAVKDAAGDVADAVVAPISSGASAVGGAVGDALDGAGRWLGEQLRNTKTRRFFGIIW